MKCTFCDSQIERGTGKILVKNDGKILNFCSKKCEKNMIALKRVPRRIKWTGLAHSEKAELKAKEAKK